MSGKLIDLTNKTFTEWRVTGEHRMRPSNGQFITEWPCACSCGAERWVSAAALRRGKTKSCGGVAHRVTHAGEQLGSFTVLSLSNRREATLRCVCGRIRTFSSLGSVLDARTTCGCNGIDQIFVCGDPNLPKGVKNYMSLIRWAGCSRQAHYQMIALHGFRHAVEHLEKLAEKKHPKQGWRITTVIPIPCAIEKQEQKEVT